MTPEQLAELQRAGIHPNDELYPVIASLHNSAEKASAAMESLKPALDLLKAVAERLDRRERQQPRAIGGSPPSHLWWAGVIAIAGALAAGGYYAGHVIVLPAELTAWRSACSPTSGAVTVANGRRQCVIWLDPAK